jgi:uncharacterized membrane protein
LSRRSFTSTRTIVLIGLFAAICYVALYFKIPIPSPVGNPFLHMGNMFVILASLLFNGYIGGISGSLGMGLFDLMNGYAAFAPKTLILKLGIGLITGKIAGKKAKQVEGQGRDSKASPARWIFASSIFFITVGIVLLITTLARGYEIVIPGVEKPLVINPVLYIFSLILGVLLVIAGILSNRYSIEIQYAIIGAVAGIAFNLVGEFLFGVGTLLLAGSSLYPAIIGSAISLPATLINGTFSIVVAVALYIPLKKALSKFDFAK